jgi:hypothetical protein
MSVKMSDMKPASKPKTSKSKSNSSAARSFTLRDPNRQPAKVLAACDLQGTVRIHTRDGRSYTLRSELPEASKTAQVDSLIARRQQLRQRLRAAGFVPPSAAEIERINRLIAGESSFDAKAKKLAKLEGLKTN